MPTPNCWNDAEHYDFDGITAALNRYLKLKTMPVGMKRVRTVEEMAAIPRIRRPNPAEKLAWMGMGTSLNLSNNRNVQVRDSF